jgi:transcriptional regulator with XRE-family HTH domain
VKSISSAAFQKKLGARIRAIRKKQKVSQKQLAFECDLSREQVYRMELGNKNVTVDTLRAIAGALDVHVREFFDFDY